MDGVALGADTELFVANPGQGAQIARLQLVFTDHCDLGGIDLLFGERNIHAQDFGAIEQAVSVLGQTEYGGATVPFVRPHAFKCPAAVVQGMGQHMYLGITPLHHLAIHPDFSVAVRHRGR
jgi:hypothetical protein